MTRPAQIVLWLAVLASGCARQDTPSPQAAAPQAALAQAAAKGNWVTYGGPLSGDRYSPLAQITTANVAQLRQVCAFDAAESVNFQSGIVAVDGVLYFTLFNYFYEGSGNCSMTLDRYLIKYPIQFS